MSKNSTLENELPVRVIIAMLHELLKEQPYSCYADLKADLRQRCARLRIRYDMTTLAMALDQVERGGRRVVVR